MKKLFLIIAITGISFFRLYAQAPGDNFGFKATPFSGGVPVLTILLQFADTEPFPADYKNRFSERVFGRSGKGTVDQPSLGGKFGFYDQISNGNFNFLNAGIIGPINVKDVPGTTIDESTHAGFYTTYSANSRSQACLVAEAAGVNFTRFDRNGDRIITRNELCINVINSERLSHEFIATTERGIYLPPSGSSGATMYNDLGYSFSKVLGYVYSASSTLLPAGTKPLNFWFKPATGDNYSTTLTSAPGGYSLLRAHGFIFQTSLAVPPGTVPVFTWYNAVRRDYLLTTASNTSEEGRALYANGYNSVRHEGFIFNPTLPPPSNTIPLYLWEGHGLNGGGGNRSFDIILTSGLHIQSDALDVGQDCINNMPLLAHEMIHFAGGIDVYGAGGAKNTYYSLMGASFAGQRVSHPDPMNKIMAGWIEPIVKTIGKRETFEILGTEISKNSKGKAYVFYDPARGKKEFFILEYRYRQQLKDSTHLLPLYNLWDKEHGDNYATTSYSDDVLFDSRDLSLRYHKTEGFIFNPSNPRPAGTVPLYCWYSNSYGDGFTTTNSFWASSVPGERKAPNYAFQGVLGYIYDPELPQPENTLPLYLWFSPSRQDNFITTDKSWVGTPGVSRMAPDYTCVRLEGYIKQGAYFNYDGAPFCNLNGIPDNGLAIWYVKIGSDGVPLIINARDQAGNTLPGETDRSVYIMPQNSSWGFSQNLFKSGNGIINVSWPDGTSSGLRVEVLTTNLSIPILKVSTR